MTTWNTFVLAFAITAGISDLWRGKIPRVLTMSGLFLGLAYHLLIHQFWTSLAAAAFGFVIGVVFFRLGAIGGGDVKLISAMGALLGFSRWATAMEAAIFVAGFIALVQLLRRKTLRQAWRNMGDILRGLKENGLREHSEINIRNRQLIASPFGVAVAAGTLMAVLRV